MASSRRLAVTGDVPWPEDRVYGMAVCPDGTVALASRYPDHCILRATLAADCGSCSLQMGTERRVNGRSDNLTETYSTLIYLVVTCNLQNVLGP